jgi:hypothetical protein
MFIGKSKKDQRVAYWQTIKSRVTTHEGEMLSGKKGQDYQKKYSKKHLGRDLSRPVDFNRPEYQKELNNS